MTTTEASSSCWSSDDDKIFELALGIYGHNVELIAQCMGKDLQLVQFHYDALSHDVVLIESGKYPVEYPEYSSPPVAKTSEVSENGNKRGKLWSTEEHRAFLVGLQTRGQGDWKNIARDFVKTRTSSQVASHAQKFIKRQSGSTVKKRSSIHDITSVETSSLNTIPRSLSDSMSQPPHSHQRPPRYPHSQEYFQR